MRNLITTLWAHEDTTRFSIDCDPPSWLAIDTVGEVAAIQESLEEGSGLSSGVYMPAVTYRDALETMRDHGNSIFTYLEEQGILSDSTQVTSWAQMACFFVSSAVEAWVSANAGTVAEAVAELSPQS